MTEYKITKMTSGTYSFSAFYTINEEHNGIEITFSEKPGDIIRDELKKIGFRWHNVKKVWYAKNRADRLELAERLATREQRINEEKEAAHAVAVKKFEEVQKKDSAIDALEIPESKFVDGGGLYDGWEGGNNRKWNSDKELKTFLLSDFKRAGISATIRFRNAGFLTSLTVTIKIRQEEIASYEEFKTRYNIPCAGWLYYTDDDEETRSIHSDDFWSMSGDERAALEENIKQRAYRSSVDRLTKSGHNHGNEDVLTEEGNKKLDTVRAIVTSYNRDCSNSQLDYFDRDIYDNYAFKIA